MPYAMRGGWRSLLLWRARGRGVRSAPDGSYVGLLRWRPFAEAVARILLLCCDVAFQRAVCQRIHAVEPLEVFLPSKFSSLRAVLLDHVHGAGCEPQPKQLFAARRVGVEGEEGTCREVRGALPSRSGCAGILRGIFFIFWSNLLNSFGLRVGAVTFPPFVLGDEGIDPWLRNFWDVEGVGVNGVGG